MDYLDKMKFERLKKLESPNDSELQEVFEFYKKYIDPTIVKWVKDCTCQNSIEVIYQKLMGWYNGQT